MSEEFIQFNGKMYIVHEGGKMEPVIDFNVARRAAQRKKEEEEDEGEIEEGGEIEDERIEPLWLLHNLGPGIVVHMCPKCGAMFPFQPAIMLVPPGEQTPLMPHVLHERWHKTVMCDWYD